jgi:triphosphoribosyl-dephospho-CoA synthase
MNLQMLRCSATVLYPTFLELAQASAGVEPSVGLRRVLGALGREGETTMMLATGGCNTHRGAIWTLGLLCAAAAGVASRGWSAATICTRAASIARIPESDTLRTGSHGALVMELYDARGARGEAEGGFPHVQECALPALRASRAQAANESAARLNALLALMATLDDTCLLYRGGTQALRRAQRGAWRALEAGGLATVAGMRAVLELDRELVALNSSPGGSADLLAAALFLDRLTGGR